MKSTFRTLFTLLVVVSIGCASSKKKQDRVALSQIQGKRVALIDIDGPKTAKRVAEVSLINVLVKEGNFILVPKKEIERIRSKSTDLDPTDSKAIAKRANADYALNVKIHTFDTKKREGVSEEEVYDSQIEEEQGSKYAKTKRLYKVKTMTATVDYELLFTNLAPPEKTTRGRAKHEVVVKKDNRKRAVRFPGRLTLLEQASNKAFQKFFDEYQD